MLTDLELDNIHGAIGRGGVDIYSMDLIAEWVRCEHLPDVRCYVEQTGGGCATVYLGGPYYAESDWNVALDQVRFDALPRAEQARYDQIVPVMAGPGWFAGPGWTDGRADPGDFAIGYDVNDPEVADHPGVDGFGLDPVDEYVIARLMAELYREHPRVKRGEIK